MPGDASGPAKEINPVAENLRWAIASGVIPPGERIRAGSPGWPCGLSGTTARSALAIVRRGDLAYWHRYEYYAAPAGPPRSAVSARLGREHIDAAADAGGTLLRVHDNLCTCQDFHRLATTQGKGRAS